MLDDNEREDTTTGKAFVWQEHEPQDEATNAYVADLGEALGILTDSTRPTSRKKIIRCLSDLIKACEHRHGELICWSMNSAHYSNPPYAHLIASTCRDAAVRKGLIKLAHKGEKGIAARYRVCLAVPEGLQFKPHGEGRVVEVRDAKPDMRMKTKRKGRKIPLHKFGVEGRLLEQEMRAINKVFMAHPLKDDEGKTWARGKRVFNDSSLESGGRIYGSWQNVGSEKRLKMNIDGEPLCEIDLKACYLFIANALTGHTMTLKSDPYSEIRFVKEVNCPDRRKVMRDAAKKLTCAFMSKGGEMTKFPKGQKDKTTKRTIPFKDEFELGKGVRFDDLIQDIYRAYPFLRGISFKAGTLMLYESNIMAKTLLALADIDIPAYPIHDCLLCKVKDKDIVIDHLQKSMIDIVGYQGFMDIEYIDGSVEFVSPDPDKVESRILFSNPKTTFYDWGMTEDDFDPIEEG